MADDLYVPAERVPVLTEVVEFDGLDDIARHASRHDEGLHDGVLLVGQQPTAEWLVQRVLGELLPQLDALLEAQVRAALAPALARAAEVLVREAQAELPAALQALVREAVARALDPPT